MMESLIGTTIYRIWLDVDEQHYLKFWTDKGTFIFYAEGDCCSESWFYAVMGTKNLLGHTVKKVNEITMDDISDTLNRQECDTLYAVNFQTTGGWAGVEFRNSSNGYYGGWLTQLADTFEIPNWMEEIDTDYIAQVGAI